MKTSANQAAPVDAPTARMFAFDCQWRRATDQRRYRDMKLHSILFGWSNPDQALRVAASIPGKRASGGRWPSGHYCQGCEAFPTTYRTWEPQSGVELEWEDTV